MDLQILLTLAEHDLHGYGIKLDIAERTAGRMSLGSGTLYEAIQRLEQRGFIAPTRPPDGEESDPRRRSSSRPFSACIPQGSAVGKGPSSSSSSGRSGRRWANGPGGDRFSGSGPAP